MPAKASATEVSQQWTSTNVDHLAAGMDLSVSADQIDPSASPLLKNVLIHKTELIADTGYSEFGQELSSPPRYVHEFNRKSGATETVLITNLTAYTYSEALGVWLVIPGDVHTVLDGNFVITDTALTVDDSTGFTIGNVVVITLDNGQQHTTTVAAVPDGTHITLTDGLPSAASTGKMIFRPVVLAGTDAEDVDAETDEAVDWMIFTNGVDPVKRYDGVDIQTVPGLPSAGNTVAKTVAIFNNALWLGYTIEGGTSFPQRMRRSDTGDPTEWVTGTAGFEDLYGKVDYIKKIKRLGPYLMVYSPRAIVQGTWVGSADKLVSFDIAIEGTGIFTIHGVDNFEDVHAMLSQDDLHVYGGGVNIESIGKQIRNLLFGREGELNYAQAPQCFLRYIEEQHELWLLYTFSGDNYPRKLLRLNTDRGGYTIREFTHELRGLGQFSPTAFGSWLTATGTWASQTGSWMSREGAVGVPNVLLLGHDPARVYRYDLSSIDDNGVAIPYRVETKDFINKGIFFRIDQLTAYLKGADVSLEYSIDSGENWGTYGTFSDSTNYRVQTLHHQIVCDQIRFAFISASPGFALKWISFDYVEESEW